MSLKVNKYKGYIGTYEPDPDGDGFYGSVSFISDLVTFSGTTRQELQSSFEEGVDDYLIFCDEIGKEPKKSFNGQFNVRVSPELHEACSLAAMDNNVKLNQFVVQALEAATSPSNSTIVHKHIHLTVPEREEVFKAQARPLNVSTYSIGTGAFN